MAIASSKRVNQPRKERQARPLMALVAAITLASVMVTLSWDMLAQMSTLLIPAGRQKAVCRRRVNGRPQPCARPQEPAPDCCSAPPSTCSLVAAFEDALDAVDKRIRQDGGSSRNSAGEIARRYGLPKTAFNCGTQRNATTTVGWVPRPKAGSSCPFKHIPCVLYQTWKSHQLSAAECRGAGAWQTVNPEFDYILMDNDIDSRAFVYEEYGCSVGQTYDCIQIGAAKADVWRLLMIYRFGGFYFDLDSHVKASHPFRNWGLNDADYISGGVWGHQWGVIFRAGHPVLRTAVEHTLHNLAMRSAKGVYDVSYNAYGQAWKDHRAKYRPQFSDADNFGERIVFINEDAKADMTSGKDGNVWWQHDEKTPFKKNCARAQPETAARANTEAVVAAATTNYASIVIK
jgi:hypothetical protein